MDSSKSSTTIKICLICITIGLIAIFGLYCYNTINNSHNNNSSGMGFSFENGFNIKINLGKENDNKFKIDVTDEHVHVSGVKSIINRVFDYFSKEKDGKN